MDRVTDFELEPELNTLPLYGALVTQVLLDDCLPWRNNREFVLIGGTSCQVHDSSWK